LYFGGLDCCDLQASKASSYRSLLFRKQKTKQILSTWPLCKHLNLNGPLVSATGALSLVVAVCALSRTAAVASSRARTAKTSTR